MTKAPKKPDSRAKALAGMTKAELVRTVKQLDARQTKLLNEIARLKRTLSAAEEPYTPKPVEDCYWCPACETHVLTSHVCKPMLALSAEMPANPPTDINPNNLETAEIEIKDPSEQEGFKITRRPLFPWEQK